MGWQQREVYPGSRVASRHRSSWTILLFLLVSQPLRAALLFDSEPSYSLAGHLEQLIPTTASADIDDVADGLAGNFTPLQGHLIDGTGQTREVWLRFTLTAGKKMPDTVILRVMPPLLDLVELYQPTETGWRKMAAGDTLPISKWPMSDRASSFSINLATGASRTYYVRIKQNGLLNAYFMLYAPQAFHQTQLYETLGFGLYFGVLFSLILSNLLHWATLRDPIFGELSLFLSLRAAFLLSFNGLLFLYLMPEHPHLSDDLLRALVSLTAASQILLTQRVLALPTSYPLLSKLFYLFSGLTLVIALSVLVDLFTRLVGLLAVTVLVADVLSVLIAMDHVRRRRPLGRILLTVMVLVLLCQLTILMPALGFDLGIMVDLYGRQAGSVLIAIAIHVAVAVRVFELKKARNASEQVARIAAGEAESERAARKEQADFVSMLFHEIKTPLAEIDSATTVLEHLDEGNIKGTGDRYDTIHGAVERLNRLVEQSLARDRQGLDATHLNRTDTGLRQLAETVLNSFRGIPGNRLILSGGEDMAPLQADPEMLRIALANLIDNAIKYSPPGDKIQIRLATDGHRQTLTVCDSGPGMDKGAIGRAFDRYWRGNSAGGITGAGLGLYLVRKIIQAHGGEVSIESEPGNGSRFVLALPESAI